MMIKDDELLTDTPFVAIDLDIMERNMSGMANLARKANVKLRPHTKTHKSPDLAKLQLDYGARGITTAKLGEAEVMVEHGVSDILIAYPLIGRKKLQRFYELLQKAELTVGLDDIAVARGISDVGNVLKRKIPIYIDVDTGLHRMGREAAESVDYIAEIAKLPFIDVRGLMSHAGHAYMKATDEERKQVAIDDAALMYQTKTSLAKLGIEVPEISVGATATARFILDTPHVTEMRPGMYVFNDRNVMAAGGVTEAECAATVFATIVSRPDKSRLIMDAGSKTLSQDACRLGGHGYIKGYPQLTIKALSEEHGVIEVNGEHDLQVGSVIEIIPNHICPVINLADRLYGFREGELVKTLPVLARGKNT
ncbi:alanine racemase [Paenibacillus sp. MBLB4367]|uniref:alanine racemase n=1 Tax=Paenibacillus sp. MBLB4367 TaxID=3384767 RepID=UPI003907EC48